MAKAQELLKSMGHPIYYVVEVRPSEVEGHDVWIVSAATIAGILEIVLKKADGTIIEVRRKDGS